MFSYSSNSIFNPAASKSPTLPRYFFAKCSALLIMSFLSARSCGSSTDVYRSERSQLMFSAPVFFLFLVSLIPDVFLLNIGQDGALLKPALGLFEVERLTNSKEVIIIQREAVRVGFLAAMFSGTA